ncbi:MAG: serine hydrolase [Desulfitobacteriia bacterium]|jgi:D-alanyl-D-alanine carboxypeptidase (penicillin-binding protein 5/6)
MRIFIRRLFIGVLIYLSLFTGNCFAVAKSSVSIETSGFSGGEWSFPYVTAHSALLMDALTGEILYERDAHRQRPPASTTKVLTAIVALEMAKLNEIATVSEKADQVGESSIYLNKGNRLALRELLEGALIRSGNDACVAIAEQAAGSLDEFMRLMNLKAVSLGATRSNFVNPHGLPDKNHYSTAYDLAVIARYAMQDETFAHIVAQKYSTIEYEEPAKIQEVKNTNKLLWTYPYADGIKTGTTNAAGKCLIASASKEGRRLICVLLDAPDRFGDAERLMDWGFKNTEIVSFGKKGDPVATFPFAGSDIPLVLTKDLNICIRKENINTLGYEIKLKPLVRKEIKAGEVLGYYYIFTPERLLKKEVLVTPRNYKSSPLNFFKQHLKQIS